MAVVANRSQGDLRAASRGGWWWPGWGSSRVRAGLTDRRTSLADVIRQGPAAALMHAAQVHGSSIAWLEGYPAGELTVQGCDALISRTPGVGLVIRTADCLPLFVQDPGRQVIGIAHAGWRGLAARLPLRFIAAFQRFAHSRPEQLLVAVGPAIHACCYEVSAEFGRWFEPFLQRRSGRLTCDLIGAARHQFAAAGVTAEHWRDSGHCTGCEPDRWFSVRREGPATGRLHSFIMLE